MSNNKHGATRRSVVKGAAWTAPAIVVATAAPAMAASGTALVTVTVPPTNDLTTPNTLPITVNFSNANTGSATATVTVVVAAGAQGGGVSGNNAVITSSGWTGGTNPSGNSNSRTFVFTGPIPGAATATGTASTALTFSVTLTPQGGTGLTAGNISVSTSLSSGGLSPLTPNPRTAAYV